MTSTNPAPGWYPDPSGAPQSRWWDGIQWHTATQQTVAPYSATGANYFSASEVNPSTVPMWIIALLPIASLLSTVVYATSGGFAMAAAAAPFTAADGFNVLLTLAIYVSYVVLAFVDHKALQARGLDRPFAPGWAFIPIVYIIGRSTTVYQRTRRGLAPLFVWIGSVVANWIFSILIGVIIGMTMDPGLR